MKPRTVAILKRRGATLTYATTERGPKQVETIYKPGSLKAFAAKEKR